MFNCLCKARIIRNLPKPQSFDLRLTQKKLFFSCNSKRILTDPDGQCLTARYLVSALGFTPESALSALRSGPFVSPEKAAEVVGMFNRSGFSQAQISKIVVRLPRVLSFMPDKTILPKIEFLKARGASEADIVRIICGCPRFLCRSLEKHIVPTFDMISGSLESDSQAIVSATRCASLWFLGNVSAFVRNVDALKAAGVPDDGIRFLLRNHPNSLWASRAKFDHALERVKSIGSDPSKVKFVVTLHVLTGLAKSTWEKKVSMFGRWGWSNEGTLRAFVKFPHCMMLSEEKLMAMMEFFVNKMGVKSTYFASHPVILSLSFKNRIVPRCMVIEALVSKKLIRPVSLLSFLPLPDISFVEKFISPYSKEHPGLQKMYLAKLSERSSA